ncbi:hypothetical protein OSTOST_03491 [Ostertagia ostertagi]
MENAREGLRRTSADAANPFSPPFNRGGEIAGGKLSISQKKYSPPHQRHRANHVLPFHEIERLRSIVIGGIAESISTKLRDRLSEDFHSVFSVFDYLGVKCTPVTVYRMGKNLQDRSRLLEVVLSSRFQRMILRRAPRLRYLPQRGIFLRQSLTKGERERRRALRHGSKKGVFLCSGEPSVETPDTPCISASTQSPQGHERPKK